MNILYIHQHFAVPGGSTGTRSYEFARRWVNAGHKVTVVTGRYDVGGLEVGKGLIHRQTIDGINVVIVGTKYGNKQSFLRRIISFLCFMVLSVWVGLKTKNVDVIYATSTPLTVGIPAMALKFLKRVPFVFEVRDQWPEILIELGIIKNKLLINILLWLERKIYKSAVAIVALSPGMASGVRTVLKEDKKIVIVPNSSDTLLFKPGVDGSQIRREYGWKGKFVILHFGAMGRANGLDFLIDAAEKLKEKHEIRFVLVGDGSEKSRLISKVKEKNLTNIEILDSRPKSDLPKLVAACDISTVIFADFPILEHNSANKFFDSLSAGKPVLLNYSGWQREILEDNFAGFGCDLYNLDEFVEKVLYLSSHPQEVKQMGLNARKLAIERFDRDRLAQKALDVITSL
ncbi:MAG: glycosyltransferase family 4 protein [Planctomycetes bacterium]|nr:glycosyltransferase family 4 protein [Planctomycetota bacterium]